MNECATTFRNGEPVMVIADTDVNHSGLKPGACGGARLQVPL